jgi:hypothetical protein
MSALDLLAEAAAEKPVLLLVDDAQWMDPASQQALAFIARRLASDRIVMLATHRLSDQPASLLDPSLPAVELAALDEQAAAELLDRSALPLEPRVRSAVLDFADGNPLALLELPQTVGPATAADGEWLPLTKRLENSFVARIEDLGAPTRTALTTLMKTLGSTESRANVGVRSTLRAVVRPEQMVRSPRSVMAPRASADRGRPSQCSSMGTIVAPSASWTKSARSRSSISSVFKMKGIAPTSDLHSEYKRFPASRTVANATVKIDSGHRVR